MFLVRSFARLTHFILFYVVLCPVILGHSKKRNLSRCKANLILYLFHFFSFLLSNADFRNLFTVA